MFARSDWQAGKHVDIG